MGIVSSAGGPIGGGRGRVSWGSGPIAGAIGVACHCVHHVKQGQAKEEFEHHWKYTGEKDVIKEWSQVLVLIITRVSCGHVPNRKWGDEMRDPNLRTERLTDSSIARQLLSTSVEVTW